VESTEYSLVARNLTKSYGRNKAISDLSFQIEPGEVVGFLGPNGAGKTTTMRILTGLLAADSGSVEVDGVSVARHPEEVRRKIGYMPENNPLPEDMRVQEYLAFRSQLKGLEWRRRRKRIEHVLQTCDLQRKTRNKLIGTLSKGFRQRVGIADALLAEPPVTILDEPTIGLDPHQVLVIRELLQSLRGKTTILLSSHILSEVEVCCDRVLIINQGRLVAGGTSRVLREEFLPFEEYRIEWKTREGADGDKLIRSIEAEAQVVQREDLADGWSRWRVRSRRQEVGPEEWLTRLHQSEKVRLRTFEHIEPSLEDIFIAATKRSWTLGREEVELAPVAGDDSEEGR